MKFAKYLFIFLFIKINTSLKFINAMIMSILVI